MRVTFEHLGGSKKGARQELEVGHVTAGRNPHHALAFDPEADAEVSGNHAEFKVGPSGKLEVTDLGSSNGTFVNGERIERGKPATVDPGGTIRFGARGPAVKVMYAAPRGAAPPAAPAAAPAGAPASPPPPPAAAPAAAAPPGGEAKSNALPIALAIGGGVVFVGLITTVLVVALSSGGPKEGEDPASAPGEPVASAEDGGPGEAGEGASRGGEAATPDAAAPPKPATDDLGRPLPEGAIARLGTARLRHGHRVNALAFSRDGKTIASASADGTVRFWDVETGKETRTLAHPQGVNLLAFSKDEKLLATEADDRVIRLWDLASGKVTKKLKGFGKPVETPPPGSAAQAAAVPAGAEEDLATWHLAFAPDGKTLAIGTNARTHLLDLESGKRLRSFPGVGPVFSPDGKTVVVTAARPEARGTTPSTRAFDVATGKPGRILEHGAVAVAGTTVHVVTADGQLLTHDLSQPDKAKPDRARVVKKAALAVATKPDDPRAKPPFSVAFSASGTVAALFNDAAIRFVDLSSGDEIRIAPRPSFSAIALAPDGKRYALARGDAIRILDAATGRDLAPRTIGRIVAIAASSDGTRVAVADQDLAVVWDVEKREAVATADLNADGQRLGTDGPGPELAFAGRDALAWKTAGRAIAITDLSGRLAPRVLPVTPGERASIAAPGDGKLLAFAGTSQGKPVVEVWSTTEWKGLKKMAIPRSPAWMGFSPDASLLAAAVPLKDGAEIALWSTASGKKVRAFAGGKEPIEAAAFSSDGSVIAVAQGRAVMLWDVESGTRLRAIPLEEAARLVAFVAGDRRLVAAGAGVAVVFEAETGEAIARAALGGAVAPGLAAVAPGGTAIVAPDEEGSAAFLWSLEGP